MTTDPYLIAKSKIKKRKGFYGHLAAYLCVNIVMFLVVLLNEGTFEWLFPMSFWGIGLGIHYMRVFGLPGIGAFGTKEWEEDQIKKELEKQGFELQKPIIEDELELKEFKELRKEYRDEDLV